MVLAMSKRRKNDLGNGLAWAGVIIGAAGLVGTILGMQRASVTANTSWFAYGYEPGIFSRYYNTNQLRHSNTAQANGISNVPGPDDIQRGSIMAQFLLDPITDVLRESNPNGLLNITSWYRSPELNAHPSIGGSSSSDHLKAEGIDVSYQGGNDKIIEAIVTRGIGFDQLIIYPGYLHLSYDTTRSPLSQKNEVLRKDGNAFVSLPYEELYNYL